MFGKLIKRAGRYAGVEIIRSDPGDFRWSHTVEEYYPVTPKVRWQKGKSPHTQLCEKLEKNRVAYGAFLDLLMTNASLIHGIPYDRKTDDPNFPFWNNPWFTALDAAALVNVMVWKRPLRYCEIGSGHSTCFAKYTINALGLDTKITSIDPAPRQSIDRICDRVIRSPLESCDLSIFDELSSGDVVFFDGSHRAFANSDVVVFFFEVMPRLKSGVLVHIHDIFVPDDYPADWKRRLYNEQYILAAMLMCEHQAFRVIAPIAFICQDEVLCAQAKRAFVSPNGGRDIPFRPGGSFWLEIERAEGLEEGHELAEKTAVGL